MGVAVTEVSDPTVGSNEAIRKLVSAFIEMKMYPSITAPATDARKAPSL